MKCASSAEADVFVQAVAFFIAVISPTVRRCDLPVWLLLRTATIAFATKPLVIQATSYQWASPSQQQTFVLFKSLSGKSTSSDGDQERVCWLPANTVPIQDCDSACRKAADSFPPAVTAGCGRLLHSDNLAIQKTVSSCETNHFPYQAKEYSKSTVVSTPWAFAPKYCESLPIVEGNNHNEVCIVG